MKDVIKGQGLFLRLPFNAKVNWSWRWQSGKVTVLGYECIPFEKVKWRVFIDDALREEFSTKWFSGPNPQRVGVESTKFVVTKWLTVTTSWISGCGNSRECFCKSCGDTSLGVTSFALFGLKSAIPCSTRPRAWPGHA